MRSMVEGALMRQGLAPSGSLRSPPPPAGGGGAIAATPVSAGRQAKCPQNLELVEDDQLGSVEMAGPRIAHPEPDRAELLHERSRRGYRIIGRARRSRTKEGDMRRRWRDGRIEADDHIERLVARESPELLLRHPKPAEILVFLPLHRRALYHPSCTSRNPQKCSHGETPVVHLSCPSVDPGVR